MWLLADSQLVSSLFIAGLLLLSASLLIRLSRRLSRRRGRQTPMVDSRRLVEPSGGKRDALADQLAQWEVRMHQTARDLSGQLTSRISVLQALVAEADRAAARLEAALAEWEQLHAPPPDPRILPQGASSPAHADSRRQTTAATAGKAVRCEGPHGPPQKLASTHVSGCGHRGCPTADPPPGECAFGDVQPAESSPAGRRRPADNSRSTPETAPSLRPDEQVCLLADYGFPSQEIARRLGVSLQEVETIVRQRRQDPGL